MYDNGLVQYFREHKNELGQLKTKELRFPQYYGEDDEECLQFLKTPSQLYFKKRADKDSADAEVLLSQIYKNAGFDTALYVPALDKKRKPIVLSNDVRSQTSIDADLLYKQIARDNPGSSHYECVPQKGEFPFVLPEYLTDRAIKTTFEMNAFDLASKNFDRHSFNYLYDNPNPLGQYDDIKLFDYGHSGYAFGGLSCGFLTQSDIVYPNQFLTGHDKPYQEMVWQLKNNAVVKQYVSSSTLGEMVGSVDVEATARDIKESIGYTVSPQYVDFLTRSFEQTATDLTK
ncbi:MAG: hypothetical protein IKI95_01155 [Clostridia bacterium]|nr:hypothetical protein [Clostridia bacterium]